MKKTYEKPQIYMEKFELAEHIASGCGNVVAWRDNADCFSVIGGVFAQKMGCQIYANPEQQGEDYCYYAAGSGLFTS